MKGSKSSQEVDLRYVQVAMIPQAWLWMFSVQQLEQGSIDTSFVSAASPWLDDSNCTKMELCIPNSLAFFSGSCHSHRHCRLLRQGDATKQFLLRLCLSFLSVSHACLGVGANLEVRFNLDPFGKKSDEDLLGDNLSEEGARALLADLRGMLQLQELWEAFAEFTASPASVTEVDSISSPLVSHCVCCALPLSCGAVASSESFLLA